MSRLRVAQSAVRCPWCHADIAVSADDWVACRACMARHHAGCWDGYARCASCGAKDRLGGAPEVAIGGGAAEVRRLRYELARSKLDHEWGEVSRRRLGPNGQPSELSAGTQAFLVGAVFVAISIGLAVWSFFNDRDADALRAMAVFVLIPGALISFAVFTCAQEFEDAYARYKARRLALVRDEERGA